MPPAAELNRIEETLERAYADGVVVGRDGTRHPIAPAGTDRAQGQALRRLVATQRAAATFEVGLAMGLSTLNICAGLLEGGAENPRHHAIDPTEEWLWKDAGALLVEQAGLADVVEVIREESQAVLPRWVAEGRGFDIAFIDGDHRFDPCFVDVYYAMRMVKGGGLIVVDDVWMPSVRSVLAYFESNIDGLQLAPDALPDGFRWTRKPPWRRVRTGTGQTAVLRKPMTYVERDQEHFVPFW